MNLINHPGVAINISDPAAATMSFTLKWALPPFFKSPKPFTFTTCDFNNNTTCYASTPAFH